MKELKTEQLASSMPVAPAQAKRGRPTKAKSDAKAQVIDSLRELALASRLPEPQRDGGAVPRVGTDARAVIELHFEREFYLARNTDVAALGLDPIDHYLEHGWRENRDPCQDFSTRHYLDTNPDVLESGQNPFLHYLTRGREEGRQAMPSGYREDVEFLRPYFDADFYLDRNPDVEEAGVDPLQHYCDRGWHEGRDPSALFSTTYYLATNPDVKASGMNPFQHYVTSGWREGRSPRQP